MADALLPYNIFRPITPSNTVDFKEGLCDAIYCGSSGNIVVVMQDGTAVTFVGAFQGEILPLAAKRIHATNTTITDSVALYCR